MHVDQFDIESDPSLPNRIAQAYGLTDRDELGLLWDRDTVAFYGDPAWEARMAQTRKLAWTQKLSERSGTYTLEITTNSKGDWGGRPVVQFMPQRLKSVHLLAGGELKPVITDNFILVPLTGDFTEGQRLKVVFSAQKIPPSR